MLKQEIKEKITQKSISPEEYGFMVQIKFMVKSISLHLIAQEIVP
jgi:hypothetical protein